MSGDSEQQQLFVEPIEDGEGEGEGGLVNITADGGITKEILRKGEGYDTPPDGSEVTVHYVGTLTDGSQFDSSRSRGTPFKFKIGMGQVIKGWDQGVATMQKGELAKFTIKSDYGYGDRGSPPKIPGGATLIFEVELLSWATDDNVTSDGGVIKKVVEAGSGHQNPKKRDEVFCTAVGTIEGSGREFFNGDFSFIVDGEGSIKGLSKAVTKMKKGEKARIRLTAPYAYGAAGKAEWGIGPEDTLLYDLRLTNWFEVQDVENDGSILKKITTQASDDAYNRPNELATATVRVRGRVQGSSTYFLNKWDEPLVFVIDEDQQPYGLDRAVHSMKKNEVAQVTVAPRHGYGAQGDQSLGVPPNATLEYEVELLDFVAGKETWDMTPQEKLADSVKTKDEGNVAFKAGRLERAIKLYRRALSRVEYDSHDDPAELKADMRASRLVCHSNLAACFMRQADYTEATRFITKTLELDPSNVKALFRRAQISSTKKNWDEAMVDLKRVRELDPNSVEAANEFRKVQQKIKEQEQKDRAIYSKMFA
eukprot:gnl/Hemi2/11272_TR3897_c0_g9_i1.p1 gnl/Hemi2/11272_TR3897_c0_g9~~gnl/Hemi2/11272_TR3897_c0_g9_i1.p1  ORF type:complete len:568 (-),score=226.28 gnl/Hemi2/11272_TR3897_c0_g9_i1:223-1830(-)